MKAILQSYTYNFRYEPYMSFVCFTTQCSLVITERAENQLKRPIAQTLSFLDFQNTWRWDNTKKIKPHLHGQFFLDKFALTRKNCLSRRTCQGKIARVDWELWTNFPWQGKSGVLAFPWQGKIVNKWAMIIAVINAIQAIAYRSGFKPRWSPDFFRLLYASA